jgi:signal transduction histidine kinase/ActR/RegA family two-component response regulator
MIRSTIRVRIFAGMLAGIFASLGLALMVVRGLEQRMAGGATDAIPAAQRNLLFGALVLCLLALFLAQRMVGRIARPLRALSRAVDALAQGERFEPLALPPDAELATLARAVNALGERLARALEDVTRKAAEAAQADAAKAAFLAVVSHELRTPLNGILGLAEHLQGTPLELDQRAQLQLIERAGEDLLGIIEDILDYSRIEAGELVLEDAPFALEHSVKRALEPLELEARRKGLELSARIEDGVPRNLRGPASRLRQVLLNLVNNAVKFTAQGSVEVLVGLVEESDTHATLRFAVKDTGIGIPAERMDRLFKPFSQVESARDRRFGGTGLGLAICKDLVELLGGTCSVESSPGAGSTFGFTARFEKHFGALPPERDTASVREALAGRTPTEILPALPVALLRPGAGMPASGPRLLLVEDNPINQRMAELVLRRAGYAYDVASDGERALALHAEHPYDLILMDCQMPVLDGLEATRRIRTSEEGRERHVPIVALTANAFEADRDECMRAGMDDFLSKPFKAAALLEVIGRWVSNVGRRA